MQIFCVKINCLLGCIPGMCLSVRHTRRTLIQSPVSWFSWGEDPEVLHFVCFPNITPEPEGASGLPLLLTACPTATGLQKWSFAPHSVLRVSRDVLIRFLITTNQGESHTQNWIWFVLSVEKEAPAQMGILKSVPMDLWTSWPSFKTWCHQQKAGPGEKPVHRESNLEARVPLLIIIFLLGRCQVGFWDNPNYETCIAGFIFKKAGKNKPILMWSFITRNEAFL